MNDRDKKARVILVVEDNDSLRRMLSEVLLGSGFQPLIAADGEEGIKMFTIANEAIDLALLDYKLPGKNGLEVYDEIRRIRPVRTIFMSGFSGSLTEQIEGGREKINFIPKPFSPMKLINFINEVLRESP